MTGLLSPLRMLRGAVVMAAAVAMAVLGGSGPLPDLVLPVVVAAALLAGPSRGALLGLGAGWVVDLVPPGSPVLGSAALLYAVAGLVAGAGRREGRVPVTWVALVVVGSTAAVAAGRVVLALLTSAPVSPGEVALRLGLTAALALVAVPTLVRAEHALARRHLA